MTTGSSFDNLPKVIQEEIASFLGIKDRASLDAVSGIFHKVINENPAFWKRIAKQLDIKVTNIKDPQKDVLAYYKQQNDEILKAAFILEEILLGMLIYRNEYSAVSPYMEFIQDIQKTSDIFLQRRIIEEKLRSPLRNLMWQRIFRVPRLLDDLVDICSKNNFLSGLKFLLELNPPPSFGKQKYVLKRAIVNGNTPIVELFLKINPQLLEDISDSSLAISDAMGYSETAELARQGQIQAVSLPSQKQQLISVYSEHGSGKALNLNPDQLQGLVKEGEYFVYGNENDNFFLVTSKRHIALPDYLFSIKKRGEQVDKNELDAHIKGNFIHEAKSILSPEEVANRKRALKPEVINEVVEAPIVENQPRFEPILTLRESIGGRGFNPSHEEFQEILKEGEYLIYGNHRNEHFLVTPEMTIRLPINLFQQENRIEQVDINGLEVFIKEDLEGKNLGQRILYQEVRKRFDMG